MSVISIKDQNGNPIGGIDIALRRREESTELFRQYPDLTGHTDFYYSSLGVRVHNHLPDDQKWTLVLNRVEGLNPNWKNYEQNKLVDVDAFTSDYTFVLQNNTPVPTPNECPVNWNKDEFTAWFNKNKVGIFVTLANMQAMKPALEKCGFEWQNMCRPPDQWRPRIHQPPFLNGPCTGSEHDVDCGDFGKPWVLTFRY